MGVYCCAGKRAKRVSLHNNIHKARPQALASDGSGATRRTAHLFFHREVKPVTRVYQKTR